MSEDKAKGESMKRVRRETGREIIDLVRGIRESVGRLTSPQKEKGGSTIFKDRKEGQEDEPSRCSEAQKTIRERGSRDSGSRES